MRKDAPTALSGDGDNFEEEFRTIGEILHRDAEAIMERWFERATEEQIHATRDQREEAMDGLLQMLQSIGQRLQTQSSDAMAEATEQAREHGLQRSGIGWDVLDLVRDYEILNGVMLEHLGQVFDERLTYRQAMVIATVVNVAIGQAVESYSKLTQQRLEAQVRQQQVHLRQLTLDLTEAEHRQRQQFAATLHDDFQQLLVAMRMKLHAAVRRDVVDRTALSDTESLLNQLLAASRNVTLDLYPVVLEYESLPVAVEWLSRTFTERYGLTVSVELKVDPDSDPGPMALRRLIFDAIRELLFNVVKHGKTDHAWVRISCDKGSPWRIEVEDKGVGFADLATGSKAGQSFGLGHVRYRIEQIGGTMEIDSKLGEGTRITLTVPLQLD